MSILHNDTIQVDEMVFGYICNVSITEAVKYSLLCDKEEMLDRAIQQLEVSAGMTVTCVRGMLLAQQACLQ